MRKINIKVYPFAVLFLFLSLAIPGSTKASENISFDTSDGVMSNTATTSLSLTIDQEREMLVCFTSDDTIGNTDEVSFNGTPLSNITSVVSNHGYFKLWAFYLVNPEVGTHTADFSRSSTDPSSNWWVHCAAYKNTAQVAPEAYNTLADPSGNTHDINVSTLTSNDWTVLYGLADAGGIAAGTGSTLRSSLNDASALFDSNGPITLATSTTLGFETNDGEATGIILALAPAPSIEFDSANGSFTNNATTTVSIDIAEANEALVCFTSDDEPSNTNSVSFDSTSMSTLTSIESIHGYFKLWAFFLANPAVGTHTAEFSRSSSNPSSNWWAHCAAYKNVSQSEPEVYNTSAESTGTTHTAYITTLTDKAWTLMYGLADKGGITAGTGSTERNSLDGASALFDSDGPITTASTTSMTFTTSNGEATKIIMSLAPAS